MRQEIRREWIQTIVRVSFGRYAFSAEYLEGVRTLKKIETFDPDYFIYTDGSRTGTESR